MKVRLAIAAMATMALAACGDSATGPGQMQPSDPLKDELTCRTGYTVATREDGSQYCAPIDGEAASRP